MIVVGTCIQDKYLMKLSAGKEYLMMGLTQGDFLNLK